MATFGNTNSNTGTYGTGQNTINAGKFTGGPTSGTLQSISAYLNESGGSCNFELAVYGVTNGNLIGSTSSFAVSSSTFALFTQGASGTLNDPSGNYYICANQSNNNGNLSKSASTGGNTYSIGSRTFNTWNSTESTWTLGTSNLLCVYFTYTTSAGTTNTVGQLLITSI